ncbi:MAG: GlcG/HbpS family heme-binding protein [Nocardioidaceae bacterium]
MDDQTTPGTDSGPEGLTRRRAIGYGGALAAGAAMSQLGAEAASASEDESGGDSIAMRTISLEQAEAIVAAGIRYVRRHRDIPPMFILVVDACGEEKASGRMDGNSPASVVLVPIKAHTARSFRTPTADLAARTTDPARIASFTSAGFSLLGGGRPIVEHNRTLIGAVGVGGGTPEQDDEVARAALRAL